MKRIASLCRVFQSCQLRSSRSIVTFVHFCSGLTQCNGRSRIDEIAAYWYLSLRLDGFVFPVLLSGGRARKLYKKKLSADQFSPLLRVRSTKDFVISVANDFLLSSRSNIIFFLVSYRLDFSSRTECFDITQRNYQQDVFLLAADFLCKFDKRSFLLNENASVGWLDARLNISDKWKFNPNTHTHTH